MRLCVWVVGLYVCWCRCPQRPEEEVESPAAEVRDICKQPLDAGHQIGSSVRASSVLTTESSLQLLK